MTFDPIEAKRTARYTRQELKEFWTGPLHVKQKLFRENRAKYEELHLAGEQEGLLGPSLIKPAAPNTPYRPPAKTYTPGELKLRGEFTESYCRELFASGNSSAAKALFETDPERYQDAKDASISFGILPPRSTPRPPAPPVVEPEPLHRISNELALESGLPPGTSVPWPQFEQLIEQKLARARKVQADAAAKLEADRQTELATLTAKQQADQAQRDQKQRDLDRLAELIAPKPIVTPEAPAVAVQTGYCCGKSEGRGSVTSRIRRVETRLHKCKSGSPPLFDLFRVVSLALFEW